MRSPWLSIILILNLTGISAAEIAQAQGGPPPYQAIPPLRAESAPPPAQDGYIWRPGHWMWNGAQYRWIRGAYVVRRPHMHQWVHGTWAMQGNTWIWVAPHWQ